MMNQDKTEERAAFEAWFDGFRPGWKTERDVANDAFKAGAEWQARAALSSRPVQGGEQRGDWEGAEEWMPLAWELCANECGEDACTELIWEGGPIPEPWGDRWLKYEGQAKEMIAMVRKHVPALSSAPAREQWQPIETAPKDGSMFLGWVAAERWSSADGEGSGRTHDVSQIDFCWWRDNAGNGYFDPSCGQIGDAQDVTHWMPLPAAPGATAEPAPVREPMTWGEFVTACEQEYGEEFCPVEMADATDDERKEIMRVVGIVERHHGITKE